MKNWCPGRGTATAMRSISCSRATPCERADELRDAYMKIAAACYRDQPFYEPGGQVARLRHALESISLEPPA